MPRKHIDLQDKVEYLSILDHEGLLDKELEPEIPPEILLKLHRAMLLARRFDERLLNLQRQGRIGTFPPISGQEASQLGAIAHLQPSDWFVPSFRETAAEVWRGRSLESILIYSNGYNEGSAIPEGINNLPVAIPVGSQIIHATGIGWAAKYRQTNEIVMTFFGDGATSEGDFHEGLNFAAVFQTPTVFICQNNQWAISIPVSRQTHSATIAQKAIAYGMPGIQVDGNDILAVYSATQEATERARSGGGPTFIECVTYRVMMHTTADDPSKYRQEAEVESWRRRDPLPRFQQYLLEKGTLKENELETIEGELLAQIQKAIDDAEEKIKTLGDPMDMFNHHFAELSPTLMEQKERLEKELNLTKEEGHHG